MIQKIQKITIIGGGAWATALAHILSHHNIPITLLVRDAEVVKTINTEHCNRKYFPEFSLAPCVRASTDAKLACSDADVIVYASSMQHARVIFTELSGYIQAGTYIVSASKGIEEKSLYTMHDIIKEVLEQCSSSCCVLSGPSFAREVLENKFTTVVIASEEEHVGIAMQELFSTPFFRVYRSDDCIGVELAGATKNIIAIATGIVDETQQSYNTRAGIITRGLAEIARLGIALGAKQQTFMGLAGMGDLLLTCTGNLSRNRYVGIQLGKGITTKDIIAQMSSVAEGIYTCNAVYALSQKHAVYMPITSAVHSLLHGEKTVHDIYPMFATPTRKEE